MYSPFIDIYVHEAHVVHNQRRIVGILIIALDPALLDCTESTSTSQNAEHARCTPVRICIRFRANVFAALIVTVFLYEKNVISPSVNFTSLSIKRRVFHVTSA